MHITSYTPDCDTSSGSAGPDTNKALRIVAKSNARLGLVSSDGRIATLSKRLSKDLGFDSPEDLRGLSLNSLWHPSDRPAVACAFSLARRGHSGRARVSLAYASGRDDAADVSFQPGTSGGDDVLMTLEWDGTDVSHPKRS